MSLTETRNPFFRKLPVNYTAFDWKEFAMSETKLRLTCGIFALDASFSILYNMPVRLAAQELSFDMPCSVPTYLAQSSQSCYEAALAETHPRIPPFDQLLLFFLTRTGDAEDDQKIAGITIMHLFVLILAILQEWKTCHTTSSSIDRAPMQVVLAKWKKEWDMCISSTVDLELEQAGFTRLAAIEFWRLANLLICSRAVY
ncbi:hypothetical protein F5884DRAFT_507570 [Xylogone sp. PMI_703]|nr:hypothetical protein F5884DRAFT_507570 [Xylogone sp. PMI_703]